MHVNVISVSSEIMSLKSGQLEIWLSVCFIRGFATHETCLCFFALLFEINGIFIPERGTCIKRLFPPPL